MVVAGTGIQVGSVVASITDINTIDLDLPTTAAGTISATFDFTGTVTLGIMNLTFSVSGSSLRVQPRLYQFDGSDPTNASLGIGDASSSTQYGVAAINMDSYLTNSGVARTN